MVKRLKIVTQQPKPIESPNVVDLKSVTMERPKTSYRLSKTIKHCKKVAAGKDFNIHFYSKTTKHEIFLDEKNAKITKRSHAFKDYASSYNVDILNSFVPELQDKDIEFCN